MPGSIPTLTHLSLLRRLSGKYSCHVLQEAEYTEQFQSMQQTARVSSNLDLIDAWVNPNINTPELVMEAVRQWFMSRTTGGRVQGANSELAAGRWSLIQLRPD